MVGAETDIETAGSVALRCGKAGSDTSDCATVGNGCRTATLYEGDNGVDGVTALALLPLRFRYSATFS